MDRRKFLGGMGGGFSIITAGCISSLGGDDGSESRHPSYVTVESFLQSVDEGDLEATQDYIHPDGSISVEKQRDLTIHQIEHQTAEEAVDTKYDLNGTHRADTISDLEDMLSGIREERGFEEVELVYISFTDHSPNQDQDVEGHMIVVYTGEEWLIWDMI